MWSDYLVIISPHTLPQAVSGDIVSENIRLSTAHRRSNTSRKLCMLRVASTIRPRSNSLGNLSNANLTIPMLGMPAILVKHCYHVYPVKMPLVASTGPVLVRCWQHQPRTGPVLATNGIFMEIIHNIIAVHKINAVSPNT